MQNTGKSAIGLDGNVTALIGYPVGLLALILIFIEKDNKWVRFHSIQSILYWVAVSIIYVVLGIIGGIFLAISTTLGSLVFGLMGLLGLVTFIGIIFLAFKAYQGETFKLPVIGDMAEKWSNN